MFSIGLIISSVLLSTYNADPGPLQKSMKNDRSTVFEQFPIIQMGNQSFSAMRGGEEPYNSNSYKLLDISDEQKFEARKPAPRFWTSEILTPETCEQCSKPRLVRLYRGLYYPVIWGL